MLCPWSESVFEPSCLLLLSIKGAKCSYHLNEEMSACQSQHRAPHKPSQKEWGKTAKSGPSLDIQYQYLKCHLYFPNDNLSPSDPSWLCSSWWNVIHLSLFSFSLNLPSVLMLGFPTTDSSYFVVQWADSVNVYNSEPKIEWASLTPPPVSSVLFLILSSLLFPLLHKKMSILFWFWGFKKAAHEVEIYWSI